MPIPMLPSDCVMIESPRMELPEGAVPTPIESLPTVPLPCVAGAESAAAAAILERFALRLASLLDGISENPERCTRPAGALRSNRTGSGLLATLRLASFELRLASVAGD